MDSRLKRNIQIIKAIIAVVLGIMVIIDIVLVFSEEGGYPTFSKVVDDNQTQLIWLTFLFGGLTAKIFFNRKVAEKTWEASGALTFLVIVLVLFFLGRIMTVEVETPYQLMLLVSGGILAYRIWPQYSLDAKKGDDSLKIM